MTNEALLGGSLVIAGFYIMYQHALIARYRKVLTMAQYAMQGLLLDLVAYEEKENDESDTE